VRTLYLVSVWLHLIAVAIWVGGMLFLTLVVVPWLRGPGRVVGFGFLRDSGRRFRTIGWTCFAILLVTGSFNLWMRGVRFSSFADTAWLGSAFGKTVLSKLGFFVVVLGLSALHDFVMGPRATAAIERDPRSPAAARLRRSASWFGRLNLLLGLALMLLGVMIVRGGF
jgi:putative copper resistance protein D